MKTIRSKTLEETLPQYLEPRDQAAQPDPNIQSAPLNQREGFDPVFNAMKTGRHFGNFFSDMSRGVKGTSNVDFQEELDFGHANEFWNLMNQHVGNFDDHIAKSIPTYRETQARKGNAIVESFPSGGKMLDIGGSEGSFAKAITTASSGAIQTTVLDPNPAMAEFFNSHSQVDGSSYDERAFIHGWVEDDGTEIGAVHHEDHEERYDVIHEAMTFQFISNDRSSQIAHVKELLNPGGLFLTEEKLKHDEDRWNQNEQFKDQNHKNRYFSQKDLAEKEKMVGFQQSKQEEKSVGMVDNMVHHDDFEQMLLDNFRSVAQYWDSGNFRGYAASDDPSRVMAYVKSLGNMQTRFSTNQVPRWINGKENQMTDRQNTVASVVNDVLPSKDRRKIMTAGYAKKVYAQQVKDRAKELGLEAPEDEIEREIDQAVRHPDVLDFHEDHYHHHM